MSQILFVAHPGHELLVYGRFAGATTRVMVLTDGSGGAGQSRVDLTRDLVSRLGGEIGDPFGRYTDAQMYAAILACDVELFGGLVDELAAELMDPLVEGLISDAVEHYNPVHDLCCVIASLAVRRAAARGRRFTHLTAPMLSSDRPSAIDGRVSARVAKDKRIEAARMHGLIGDLPNIVEARSDIFEREVLLAPGSALLPRPRTSVFYEDYGRGRLAKRGGGELITYAEHVRPLAEALERHEASLPVMSLSPAALKAESRLSSL